MNRLAQEKSPYLLQHKDNPVDWYPWGEEAFEKAEREDKPVFLSVGYATCHWCHVMEHESFEDEEVARLMNEAFVSIKVDREERPDIDHTYMTVCQMLTGQGGWPLTIIMTPGKEPFYAATYLPKHSRPGRAGMLDLVPAIRKAWQNDRDNIMSSVNRIKEGFAKTLELGKGTASLSPDTIHQARQSLAGRFDPSEGGFGSAPKFPAAHNLLFLMNRYRQTGDPADLNMVHLTLKKMRLGGLWDHIGFGFHRYSTDQHWLLPHFEKMLYDQAMLLMAYAEGWELAEEPLFRQTALEITTYLDDRLTSPEGAFYSAEDADSEGEEGKFYVWTTDEIKQILDEKQAHLFLELFQFEENGNFHEEATGRKTGKNIPHLKHPLEQEAARQKRDPGNLKTEVDRMIAGLKKAREKRQRPLLDDKILTDWNGLMIAALARAGVILKKPDLIQQAEHAWVTIETCCLDAESGRLRHRLKEGEADIEAMADDYAFSVWGLIELYNATFRPRYLELALSIQDVFDREFCDDRYGGYFFTGSKTESPLGRQKEIYDGAVPSSNSVAAHNAIRLSRLTARPEFEEKAVSLFTAFSEQMEHTPDGYTHAIHAYELYRAESTEILITAQSLNSDVKEAISVARAHLPKGSVILVKTKKWGDQLDGIAPFTKHYPVQDGLSVYICRNFECKTPVHSVDSLKQLLSN